MNHRFDLLVVGREDQRVRLVAETDLPLDKAEKRMAFYQQLENTELLKISMVRSGTYYVGESFEESWDEEEE